MPKQAFNSAPDIRAGYFVALDNIEYLSQPMRQIFCKASLCLGSPWYLGKTKDKETQVIILRTCVQIAVEIHYLAFWSRLLNPPAEMFFFSGMRVWLGRG